MSRGEPTSWITVNGNHVPLYAGESKADAVKRFTESKKNSSIANAKKNTEDKPANKSKKEVTGKQADAIDDIVEKYTATTKPISGDWDTETASQQMEIAEVLDGDLNAAKDYMINELGFEKDSDWALDLSAKQVDQIDEIVERYGGSKPVSGSWDTETAHQQAAIAKELNITLKQAKFYMISELGFDKNDKWKKG